MKKPATLALCMIVKNEAENIVPCLESIRPALDDIVVLDTGSTDKTRELAVQHGARVFDFAWQDDFSAARNASIEKTACDYILWLDGDDRVEPAELAKIQSLKARLSSARDRAFLLIVQSRFADGGVVTCQQLRIFPNLPSARFECRVHEQMSRLDPSVKIQSEAITLSHTGYHDAGMVLGKLRRNLAIAEAELEKNPDNFFLRLQAGRSLGGMNRQAEAVPHLQKILTIPKLRSRQPVVYFTAGVFLGQYLNELSRFSEAIPVFLSLLADYPGEHVLHYFLGESLLGDRQYSRAAEELRRSLALPLAVTAFPLNLDLLKFRRHYFLGLACKELGDEITARGWFLEGLGAPDDYLCRIELGGLALMENNFSRAAGEYEAALRSAPKAASSAIYANLGLALRKLGRREEAAAALAKSVELDPEKVEAWIQLGYLHLENRDYSKALEPFQQAQKINPGLLDVALSLGRIHWRTGAVDQSIGQAGLLLRELSMSWQATLNSPADLARVYAKIGDRLAELRRLETARLAYEFALFIYPLPEPADGLLRLSADSRADCLSALRESAQQHARDPEALKTLSLVIQELASR